MSIPVVMTSRIWRWPDGVKRFTPAVRHIHVNRIVLLTQTGVVFWPALICSSIYAKYDIREASRMSGDLRILYFGMLTVPWHILLAYTCYLTHVHTFQKKRHLTTYSSALSGKQLLSHSNKNPTVRYDVYRQHPVLWAWWPEFVFSHTISLKTILGAFVPLRNEQ